MRDTEQPRQPSFKSLAVVCSPHLRCKQPPLLIRSCARHRSGCSCTDAIGGNSDGDGDGCCCDAAETVVGCQPGSFPSTNWKRHICTANHSTDTSPKQHNAVAAAAAVRCSTGVRTNVRTNVASSATRCATAAGVAVQRSSVAWRTSQTM